MESAIEPRRETETAAVCRTADLLIDILIDAGVEVVFGLPGGTISPLHDALMDRPAIRVLTARHESGAMFAAAGYARTSGKLGVVLVTSGPGALNAMTGLASAYQDSVPLLLLIGEVPRRLHAKNALQDGSAHGLNIVSMARNITKMAMEIPTAPAAPATLLRAIQTALADRPGPVALTLPMDLTGALIPAPRLTSSVLVDFSVNSKRMRAAIVEVSRILWRARRLVIFAGSGCRSGRAPAHLRSLAERLQVPVMTTPKGKGVFPESHPLSLGVFGHGGHPSATAYLEGGISDILVVGTSLRDPATDGWSELLQATDHFIQIDADAIQLGRNYPLSHGLVGRAEEILGHLTASFPDERRAPQSFALTTFDSPGVEPMVGRVITPQRALWELQQAMPRDTIYTCDIGEHLLFATHYLRVDDPRGFLIMTGLASMGTSIAGAVGAKLAQPDRPLVAICGDGSFTMLGLTDVAVAAREGMDLVICVLNDFRYSMVENGHEQVYNRRPSYPAGPIDIVAMAQSVGARGVKVKHAGELLALDLSGAANRGPIVVDVQIDPTIRMPNNERNENLEAMGRGMSLH